LAGLNNVDLGLPVDDLPGLREQAESPAVADLLAWVLHVIQPGDALVAIQIGPLEPGDFLLAASSQQGEADDVGHRDLGAHVAPGEVVEQSLLFRGRHPALAFLGLADYSATSEFVRGVLQ
jgi:hypothetical protein